MKVSATIQARINSTRLPGKVLKEICGKPMLALQIERIKESMLIDEVIIATSDSPSDDPIEELSRSINVRCFRGSENDVLSRIIGALRKYNVDIHAEFMGDNPMPEPSLIDSVIEFYLKNANKYDYVTNALKTTYPPGTEVFVYPSKVLYDAEKHAKETGLREHVGIHIYQHPERYKIYNLEAPPSYYMPDLHLEVDTAEDFEMMKGLYETFYPVNPKFTVKEVIEYIKLHPEVREKNAKIERRWKAFRKD